MCSGVVVVETRRRRFVSVNRVLSTRNDTVIDAICEEGRAWWLVIGPDNAPYDWSELRPLPEIEVDVAEQPAAEPSPTAEFISDLVERMGNGSLTLAMALAEFRDRSPVSEPAPTPEAAPVVVPVSERLPDPVVVPVSERLPEPGIKVLAHYFNALGNGRTICAIWVPAKTQSDSDGEDDFTKYDEETDKFYWPEGWYEQIENCEDFGWVRVYEGEVIYWQALPKWPAQLRPNQTKPSIAFSRLSLNTLNRYD